MTVARRIALAVWEFVVGDDWVPAAGIAATIGVVAALSALDVAAWWAMPAGVLAVLSVALRRAR